MDFSVASVAIAAAGLALSLAATAHYAADVMRSTRP